MLQFDKEIFLPRKHTELHGKKPFKAFIFPCASVDSVAIK